MCETRLMLTFRELYSEFHQDIFRFAYWLSGSVPEAEDVTSETFVRAWTNIGRIRTETLKGYLLRIARNAYLGEVRKRRREVALTDDLHDVDPGPERLVDIRDELRGLQEALQTLPEDDRSAFLMRTLHEMEYAEIARVLEVSEVAARVKVHRARKALLASRMPMEVG
jgi:RNA polymerase sigma-70 factor (ECF subfamily)